MRIASSVETMPSPATDFPGGLTEPRTRDRDHGCPMSDRRRRSGESRVGTVGRGAPLRARGGEDARSRRQGGERLARPSGRVRRRLGSGGVDVDEFRKLAQAALDRTLAGAGVAAVRRDGDAVLLEGQPADVLCAEAEDADLLVVGSRGLGGFRGLLLGSVSQQCVHHAPCPVVVVPPPSAPGRGRELVNPDAFVDMTDSAAEEPATLEETSLRRLVEIGIALSSELSLEALLRQADRDRGRADGRRATARSA